MKKAKEGVGDGEEEVTLRRKESAPPPVSFTPSPYNFMRRSCTFVAESGFGLRKSSVRTSLSSQTPSLRPSSLKGSAGDTPAANKVVKDRKNLAMQVRQKKELLEESVDGKHRPNPLNSSGSGGSGRMSRLVGGLRAWSSTEDVRQSFMGAIGRTVSVIKQRPASRKLKQASGKPEASEKNETISTPNGTRAAPGANRNSSTSKLQTGRTDTGRSDTNKTKLNNARNITNKTQVKTEKSSLAKSNRSSLASKSGASVTGRPKSTPSGGRVPPASDNKRASTTSSSSSSSSKSSSSGWFRHIQEAQEAYTARDGRNRRSHPQHPLPDPDDQQSSSADALRDFDDGGDIDGADGPEGSNDMSLESKSLHGASKTQDQTTKGDEASSSATSATGQPLSPADSLSKKTEHLRRKDTKIRQALEEKQHIIADILNIPHEHFENVVDMAGEPAVGNKEPKELVLAAMFQAKCLQETLNEALNIGEGDIVAARASNDGANKTSHLPLYQAPMSKLMSISTSLSQQLTSLLNLISERDDERERMRKELVASRERLHHLHMRQNSNTPASSTTTTTTTTTGITHPATSSPQTSRPNSFVSVASSTAEHSDTPDHHETDEENRSEMPKVNNLHSTEGEDSKREVVSETCEELAEATSTREEESGSSTLTEESREGVGSRENEGGTEATAT